MGPTSANTSPARFVILCCEAAKRRLEPSLAKVNLEKMRAAAVCVLVDYALAFADTLSRLFPHASEVADWFRDPVLAEATDLQAATGRFVADYIQQPELFVWTAEPDKIIATAIHGRQVLDSVH